MAVRAAPLTHAAPTAVQHHTINQRLRRNLPGYLFIAPWLFGFFVFTFGPFLWSLYLSFTDWRILGTPQWVGFDNYRTLLAHDPLFRITLKNTVYYGLFHVIGVNLISLALAQLLNQKLRGFPLFRTLFYLPTVTSGVATALVFSLMFNGNTGIINAKPRQRIGDTFRSHR